MSQTREIRMYRYWQSLKKDRSYHYEHYRKGWLPGPVMMVARRFRVPCREVRDILEAQKGGH
jgi:predicted DNA-binding transcriptional regulator AlpA